MMIVRKILWIGLFASSLSIATCSTTLAQGKLGVARELVEQLARKFSKEVSDEGVEKLTARVQAVLVRTGDEGAEAIQRIGPRAVGILESSGDEITSAAKLLAKHGDEAIEVLNSPVRRSLLATLGDDAGEVLVKHGVVAEKVLTASGTPAAKALVNLSSQNARRLVMLADDAGTATLASNTDLLALFARYGDRAMDFVWRNKLALSTGTVLAAFLANPEPFLDGTLQLAESGFDSLTTNVAKPIAEKIGNNTQWTLVLLAALLCGSLLIYFRKPRETPETTSKS